MNLGIFSESAEKASPFLHKVDPFWSDLDIRVLVAPAEHDSPEFVRQSEAFYRKLKESPSLSSKGTRVDYWSFPNDDHFTVTQNLQVESAESTRKLKEFLRQCTTP